MNARQLGLSLRNEIGDAVDIVHISRWAYKIYLENLPDLANEIQDVLLDLARMEDGEEFEYSQVDLLNLAFRLSQSEN